MKDTKFIILSMLVISLFPTCTKSETEAETDIAESVQMVPISVVARIGETNQTKTFFNEDKSFCWEAGDRIGVVLLKPDGTYRQTAFSAENSGRTAIFNGMIEEEEKLAGYATYPYNEKASIVLASTDSGESFILPSQWSTNEGENPLMLIPLVGKYDGTEGFDFRASVGVLEVNLSGIPMDARAITIHSTIPVSGRMSINNLGQFIPEEDGTEYQMSVSLPDTDMSETASFLFFCPPQTIPSGLYYELTDGNGNGIYQHEVRHDIQLMRNYITSLETVDIDPQETRNGTNLNNITISSPGNETTAVPLNRGQNNRYTFCIPENIPVNALKLTFTTNGLKVVSGDNELDNETTLDFSHPVEIDVVARDERSEHYKLTVLGTSLPVFDIETPDGVPIKSKTEWVSDTEIKLWTPDDGLSDIGLTKIKGRGNSTWYHYPKKAYNIKLDKKYPMLGMPKDKSWCFLANFGERSKVRYATGFALAKKTKAINWTPKGQFCELFLNGEYNGLYYLCEKIKVSKDRVNIKEMKAGDVDGTAVTGGYLLEFDTMYDEENKFRSMVSDLPVMIKEPDEDVLTQPQMDYIRSYIDTVDAVITSGRPYEGLVDIDSFIDVWFVKELVSNTEMRLPRSVYFHKDRNGKLVAGPVWDFDLDWFTYTKEFMHKDRAFWYKDLFRDPVFVERVKTKWNEVKNDFLGVIDGLDEIHEAIRSAEARDHELWPVQKGDYPYLANDINQTYDEAHESMKKGLRDRWQWLDTNINNL